MKYQDIITESVKTFTDAGIPQEFAEKLVSKFKVKHDAELTPVEGKPRKADLERGDMLINVLPSGEVIAMMTDDGLRSSGYMRIRYTPEGEFKTSYHTSIQDALSGMTKRGPMFMLKHDGIFGVRRLDKADPEDLEYERKSHGDDTLSGEVGGIFEYMNRTFLPRMKPVLERMVDEIYDNLRKLPKDLNVYGRNANVMNSQRAEALHAASAIEDIIDEGFTQRSLAEFLRTQGARVASSQYYTTAWPDLRSALIDFAEGDNLARAKWAKAFLDGAKYHWQQVMDMVDAPVMNALQGESVEIAEMTSAGGIATVAQPMNSDLISRKSRKKSRKKGKQSESVELDEGAREWVLGALAGMGLLGGVAGLHHTNKQALANDSQLQTLISYYEEARAQGDTDAMEQLEKRIERQKDRIIGGQGPVMGADGKPIVPKRDRTTDARRESTEITLEGDQFFETFGWVPWPNSLMEAEYQGRKVELNKPVRSSNGPKKFHVYVKNKKGNVVKVNFGDPDMEIKRDDPERRKSFRARHKCDQKKDKTTAGYWSCRKW